MNWTSDLVLGEGRNKTVLTKKVLGKDIYLEAN